jgi:CHAT domain-containing protein
LKALVAAEANAPSLPVLINAIEEVNSVSGLFGSAEVNIVNSMDAPPTVHSVANILPTAHILHIICHGQQNQDPLQSSFALRDGNLTIAEIVKLNLSNATLAFLSACETANGDKNQPDQAVHLAASMLFCGFRSVVATMW